MNITFIYFLHLKDQITLIKALIYKNIQKKHKKFEKLKSKKNLVAQMFQDFDFN